MKSRLMFRDGLEQTVKVGDKVIKVGPVKN